MKLYYDKDNSWEIKSPNAIALLNSIIKSETNKNYLTLRQCAKVIYTMNSSIVLWKDNDYIDFIGKFETQLENFYITINSNNKGKFKTITKFNVESLKNDFDFLFKLFSYIVSSMIIDRKRKLYINN